MELLIGGIVSGVAVGFLYGLLGFAIVLLFKATGVANFAQGKIATLGAFVVYAIAGAGLSVVVASAVSILIAGAIGVACYWLFMRPNDAAGHVNLTIRTIGLYLLLSALMEGIWADGQPYAFPRVVPDGGISIGGTAFSYLTLGTLGVGVALAAFTVWFFRSTDLGLMLLGLAERPDVALLLGVRTRRLSAMAWAFAAIVALVAGVLTAPRALLTTEMMDLYLLFAFTAAIIGGLTSLYGALVGGVLVGVVANVATIVTDRDAAVLLVFTLLLVVLLVRPEGMFGSAVADRL